jgi:hypothetical protein
VVDLTSVVFVPGASDARVGHRVAGHRGRGPVSHPRERCGRVEINYARKNTIMRADSNRMDNYLLSHV